MLEIREGLRRTQEQFGLRPLDDEDLDFHAIGSWVIEKDTPEQKQKFHDYLKSVLEQEAPATESSKG